MFAKFEIEKSSGGRRYMGNPAVRFFFPGTKSNSRTDKKTGGNSMVYISHDVAKLLRWIAGDMVDFYWDEDSRKVGMKRSATGLARVCAHSPGKANTKQYHVHINRFIAEKIAASWGEERSEGYSVIVTYEIVDDMLVLSFDKIS